VIITLPWPDKRLSPNARIHWRAKAAPKKQARADGAAATYASLGRGLREVRAALSGDDMIPVAVRFYPPDRRHRDDDNMVGSFKHYRDGIADALGVNDRRFRPHYFFEEPVKNGRIDVHIGDKFFPQTHAEGIEGDRAGSVRKHLPDPDHNRLTGGGD
jgi:crossover junction endodeoxyribonuclease RusA